MGERRLDRARHPELRRAGLVTRERLGQGAIGTEKLGGGHHGPQVVSQNDLASAFRSQRCRERHP